MFVATGSLILPAAFEAALPVDASTQAGVLALSRGTSVILLIIYILFLIYQLKTHAHVFESEGLYPEESTLQAQAPIAPWVTGSTLFLATVAVSFCSDYLVGSVDDVVQSFGISKTFIGLVLVPIVGNAGIFSLGIAYGTAATVTCVKLGYRIQMDLVVAITLGSCMQIALFLTPLLVVLGWLFDIPMSLSMYRFHLC